MRNFKEIVKKYSKAKGSAFHLLITIAILSKKKGHCYASRKYLAHEINVTPTYISKLAKKLVGLGEIKVEVNRGRKTNRYWVIIDDPNKKTNDSDTKKDASQKNPDEFIKDAQVSSSDEHTVAHETISNKKKNLNYNKKDKKIEESNTENTP